MDDNELKVDVFQVPDQGEPAEWTVRSYNLADHLGCHFNKEYRDNFTAESIVKSYILRAGSKLEVEYDSELGCFFAHTKTEEDGLKLKSLIEDCVKQYYLKDTGARVSKKTL